MAAPEPGTGWWLLIGVRCRFDFGTTAEVILAGVAAGEDVSTWVTSSGKTPLDYVASQVAAARCPTWGT